MPATEDTTQKKAKKTSYNKPVEFLLKREMVTSDLNKLGYKRQEIVALMKYLEDNKIATEKLPRSRSITYIVDELSYIGKTIQIDFQVKSAPTDDYVGKPKEAPIVNDEATKKMSDDNTESTATATTTAEEKEAEAAKLELYKTQKTINERMKIFPDRLWRIRPDIIEKDSINIINPTECKFELMMFENFLFICHSDKGYSSVEAAFETTWEHIEPMTYEPYNMEEDKKTIVKRKFMEKGYYRLIYRIKPEEPLFSLLTYVPSP